MIVVFVEHITAGVSAPPAISAVLKSTHELYELENDGFAPHKKG